MTEIKIEYRGYPIRYSENEDLWNCYDLGGHGKDASEPSLSKLKARIDALILSERKRGSVPCLILTHNHHTFQIDTIEGAITEYLGPKIERPYGQKERVVVEQRVAVSAKRSANSRVSRQDSPLSKHALITPEVDAALAEANRLGVLAREANAAYKAAFDAIPRVQIDDISALVKISNLDPTGGLPKTKES